MGDEGNETPLHTACYMGHAEVVKILANNGADSTLIDLWEGKTPLHFACENGHGQVIKILLESGADHNIKDFIGKKPLEWANTEISNDIKDYLELIELR